MTKTFVLGIDGASPELIEKWSNEGKLPNLKKIIDNGVFGPLESTVPPITPCAWSSFMTGMNPGKHGVYDFFYLDDKHQMRIHSSATRKAKDLWEYLAGNNIKSFVFNVPFTYPPKKINGTMITGFMTPSTKVEFTYPPSVKNEILERFSNYRPSQNSKYSETIAAQREFKAESFALSDLRFEVAGHLLGQEQYDFIMAVFNLTDHMQHWYWKYMDETHCKYEPSEEFQDTILDAYRKMDDFLGHFLAQYPDYNFFIISDHGCGPRYKDVVINNWLKEQGYLFLKKRVSPVKNIMNRIGIEKVIALGLNLGLWKILKNVPFFKSFIQRGLMLTYEDIDWEKTLAYSYGYYGPLYINKALLKSPDAYEPLRNELIAKIQTITNPLDGTQLVTAVWKKEQLYTGPYLDHLPDIVIRMGDYSFTCSSTFPFSSNELFSDPKTFGSGDHRQHGVIIAYGKAFKENYRIAGGRLMDLAPTILNMYDLTIPARMDGKVLENIFREGTLKGAKIEKQDDTGPQGTSGGQSYTDEEEKTVKDRLKSLGYL